MRHRTVQGIILIAGCVLMASIDAFARAPTRYNCTFVTYASERGLSRLDSPFVAEFIVDWDQHKAVLVGPNGIANIQLVHGSTATSFVETLGTGVVQTTTVARDLRAVHSRHTILSGSPDLPIWSQNYGSCIQK